MVARPDGKPVTTFQGRAWKIAGTIGIKGRKSSLGLSMVARPWPRYARQADAQWGILASWPDCTAASFSAASLAEARSLTLSLLSWPQAAMMSRPRGVRTGEAYPARLTISANFSIWLQSEHSYGAPGQGLNGIR